MLINSFPYRVSDNLFLTSLKIITETESKIKEYIPIDLLRAVF